jgi:TPR repeat protein
LLGWVYDIGQGVPQDYAEAVKWFRLAAEQGEANAQLGLGVMYGLGKGVPQDYTEGVKWLNLAASRASGANAKSYAELRDTVAGRMTPQQIAEAQRLAREWKPKTWDELKDQ